MADEATKPAPVGASLDDTSQQGTEIDWSNVDAFMAQTGGVTPASRQWGEIQTALAKGEDPAQVGAFDPSRVFGLNATSPTPPQEVTVPGGQAAGEAPKESVGLSVADVQRLFPEVREAADLERIAGDYAEAQQIVSTISSLIEADPVLAGIISARKEGKPYEDFLSSVLPGARIEEPDKNEDPDAYADFVLAKKTFEAERERRAKELKAHEASRARRHANVNRAFDDFAVRHKLFGDDLKSAREEYGKFVSGDALDRPDFFDVIHRGLTFENAIKEAETRGRNEAITGMKSGKTPSPVGAAGLPLPHKDSAGTTPASVVSPEQAALIRMGRSFASDDWTRGVGNW